jgi:RNA polymerase sigma-70 factor (ECF subfamily)
MASAEPDPAPPAPDPEVVRVLVDHHRRFLAFLRKRVRSREVAEDILQDAFVRGIGKAGSLREGESAVAWFYRLLRNALVDHYRRSGAEARALEKAAAEAGPGEPAAVDRELMEAVCDCVGALVDTLKPEYAEILKRVDLEEAGVRDYAVRAGISANNAAVRLHRARQALRRQVERACGTCATHGCLDCRCAEVPSGRC